jgi:hypothetical protein
MSLLPSRSDRAVAALVALLAACASWPDAAEYRSYVVELESTEQAPHGRFTLFDSRGTRIVEGAFVDGRRDGPFTFWNPDTGAKAVELEYREGLREGLCQMWFSTKPHEGKRKLELSFRAGEPHGTSLGWNDAGSKLYERTLEKGVVRSARFWDAEGRELPPEEAIARANDLLQADLHLLAAVEQAVATSLRFSRRRAPRSP